MDGCCWCYYLLLQAQYLIVLCTFKEQLQQHVRVHAVEAVMACRDIENTLQALTGIYYAIYLIFYLFFYFNLLPSWFIFNLFYLFFFSFV